jgi:NAD(P)-dependent dehydrogenase (short-subunit alcohol dehydrogenase family)
VAATTAERSMTFTRYESLADRVVIVSGGASGIGESFVRAFVANDARVAFLDLQEEAGAALAGALAPNARHAPLFVPCDLTRIEDLRATLARVRRELGPAAVLVNSAANDRRQAFAEVTPDEFDWMMAVNLRHVYFASQAVVPQMIELGHGSIINMSSLAWMYGTPELQAYAAAKAAIVGFTNSLARQVGKRRIRVNAIAPGLVLTDKQRRLWFPDQDKIDAVVSRQALPDAIAPDDIAGVALFLAADDSRMITKQVLSVNGGAM